MLKSIELLQNCDFEKCFIYKVNILQKSVFVANWLCNSKERIDLNNDKLAT